MYERRDASSYLVLLCLFPDHVIEELEMEGLPLFLSDRPIVVSIVLKQELFD